MFINYSISNVAISILRQYERLLLGRRYTLVYDKITHYIIYIQANKPEFISDT